MWTEIPDQGPSRTEGEIAVIGRYRLISELGRGGQGSVHLAEDTRLHRRVAVKILTAFAAPAPGALQRFRREASIASRLDHPGICAVYEAGVEAGVPYIVMRYVEGETLSHKIAVAGRRGAQAGSEASIVSLDSAGLSPDPASPSDT